MAVQFATIVDTISDLKGANPSELVSPSQERVVLVRGYNSVEDGGGGRFFWDPTGTASTADDGLTFASTVSGFTSGDSNEGLWRRVQDGTIVSVRWYGATETSNDYAAIQAALVSGAKLVFVPKGTYPVSDSLEIPTGVTLEGEGVGSVIKLKDGATPTAITITEIKNGINDIYPILLTDQSANPAEDITIRNLKVDGNTSGTSGQSPRSESGICIHDAHRTLVENVTVVDVRNDLTSTNQTSGQYRGFCISITDSSYTRIIGGRYEKAGYECVGVRGGAEHTLISGIVSTDQGVGRHAVQASDFPAPKYTTLENSTLTGSAGRFIAHNAPFCIVRGNRFDGDATAPVEILSELAASDSNDTLSTNIRVVENTILSENTAHGVSVRSLDDCRSEQIIISDNEIQVDLQGIYLRDAVDVTVQGNNIASVNATGIRIRSDNSTSATHHIDVSGNLLSATTTDEGAGTSGVYVGDASNVTVRGNDVRQGMEGVGVGASADQVLIADNDVTRATTGLDVDGSATNVTTRDNRT